MSHTIKELQSTLGLLQFTQFMGKQMKPMIQLTQGSGSKLGGNDEPGFIQLSPFEAYLTIQTLTDWLKLIAHQEAAKIAEQIKKDESLQKTIFQDAVECERFISDLEIIHTPLRLLNMDTEAKAEFVPTQSLVTRKIYHGVKCPKVNHTATGYLHAEDDDTPYKVDGVFYCGRCHMFLDLWPK